MLTLLRPIIGWIFFNGLYFGGIGIALASIVRKAEWGLLLMVALIPQPNVFYRLYTFPMGKDFLEVLFCADVVGIFVNKGGGRGHLEGPFHDTRFRKIRNGGEAFFTHSSCLLFFWP